jgi:alpha-glucosidase
MQSIRLSFREFVSLSAVSVVIAASLAHAQPIAQGLSPLTARFFESREAWMGAHPSYALLTEPQETVPLDANWDLRPTFSSSNNLSIASFTFPEECSLYGTGEVPGPLRRNGRSTVCWNTDAYGYDDKSRSLYQSHPWVLGLEPDGSAFGILADTTYRCEVTTDSNSLRFAADGPSFGVIVIQAPSPEGVLSELSRLTGTMPMPPKWALGYHQCRYSYFPEKRVREVASEFRARSLPCDVIWFDIDYMEAFRVFTFDRGHFPDPLALNGDLLAQGFHNVWMIDPGMKSRKEAGPSDRTVQQLEADGPAAVAAREKEIERFDRIMKSGDDLKVWVSRADGSVYEGEVWPGWCHFPDYTSPQVQRWWAGLYREFMAMGVTGVWNDMNEPAVFNVPSKTMPLDNLHRGDPSMIAPSGKPQGGRSEGTHARYHNVYGMQMIKATREGISAANPDNRPFVLSRANYIGGQRYGATWTGDNSATWAHLEESVPMVLNVGLSGQPFIGPDIGGFAGNGDGALFARWFGFGAMLPFARGHTGKGNIDKEPWAFGPEIEAVCREALNRRYRLMPYYYTLFRDASTTGLPVARPLFFADPRDAALRTEDDSFLLGGLLLIECQMVPDATRVPLRPRGIWREIEVHASVDLPRMFVKGGGIIPVGPVMQYVDEKPLEKVELWVCLDEAGMAAGSLYEDAGDGLAYLNGDFRHQYFLAQREGQRLTLTTPRVDGGMKGASPRPVEVRLLLNPTSLGNALLRETPETFAEFQAEFNAAQKGVNVTLGGTIDRPVLVLEATGTEGQSLEITIPEGFEP